MQIVELVSIYMELQNDIEKVPVSIYIVMKYCGENLVDYMAKHQDRLSLEQAAEIVYNIARGLNVIYISIINLPIIPSMILYQLSLILKILIIIFKMPLLYFYTHYISYFITFTHQGIRYKLNLKFQFLHKLEIYHRVSFIMITSIQYF